MNKETVTISKKEYEDLKLKAACLKVLQGCREILQECEKELL